MLKIGCKYHPVQSSFHSYLAVPSVEDVGVVRDEVSESFLAAIDATSDKNGSIRRISGH